MPDFQLSETIQRQRRRSRLLLWCVGCGAAALCVAGILAWLPNGPEVDSSTLVTATVQSGLFAVSVQAPGTLKSRDVRYVTAAVPGTVEDVAVQPGDQVQAGSVLLHLANPQLQAAVVAARSALADAQATLISTQADLDNQMLALQASLATSQDAASSAALKVQAEQGLEAEHVIAELDYQSSVLAAADARAQVALTGRRIAAFRRNQAAQLTAQQTRVGAQIDRPEPHWTTRRHGCYWPLGHGAEQFQFRLCVQHRQTVLHLLDSALEGFKISAPVIGAPAYFAALLADW